MTISAVKNTINVPIKSMLKRAVASAPNSKIVNAAEKQEYGTIGHNAGFIKVDKTLTPDFLKELLDIDGRTRLEVYTKIKDEILKALGFQHPELLKLEIGRDKDEASYVFRTGTVKLCTSSKYSKEKMIASLRHEIEHMLQALKIYKARGKEGFAQAILEYNKCNYGHTTETVEDVIKSININFYDAMSKDVSIADFNVEKYYKALCEYVRLSCDSLENSYKHFNNPLEKDAYAVTKRVLKAFGQDCTVLPDSFPANYTRMIDLLNINGVHHNEHEELLEKLIAYAMVKEVVSPKSFKRFVQLWENVERGSNLTPKDKNLAWNILKKVEKKRAQLEIEQKPYHQVESWLREKKYTNADLLKDL